MNKENKKTKHCWYCSSRELLKICPLQGAEYLINQSRTNEDKFINACIYETLIRHLKNAPANYVCQSSGKCSNVERMLEKVIQEKEQEHKLSYDRIHILFKTKSLTELENKLPFNHLIPSSKKNYWKIKISDNCFIDFLWKDNEAWKIGIEDKQGKKPLWLKYAAEEEKEWKLKNP